MQHDQIRLRPRTGLWGPLAVLGVALVLLLALVLLRDTFDPLARASRAAELARQQQINASLSGFDVLMAALWRLAPLVLLLGAAGVGLAVVWRRWGQHDYIRAHHVTALARATPPPLPALQTLHYSPAPRIAAPAGAPAPMLPVELERPAVELLPVPTPTFADLLDREQIGMVGGRAQPLILAYSTEGPICGDWRDLYSAGIGGLQGSGKTWTAAYLLAQSALAGARLVICDPHAGDSESLAARCAPLAPALACAIADDDRSILAALRYADTVLQQRKAGASDRTPLIVAIDEWTALRRGELADLLPTLVEDFSTEGRKLGCHVLLLGQRWDKASVGEFRNTLASAYAHRLRPIEARMLTGLPAAALPGDTLALQPGECYMLTTRGDVLRARIPHTTSADMSRVGELLARQRSTSSTDGASPASSTSSSSTSSIARPARSPFGFQPPAVKKPDETQMKAAAESRETSLQSGESWTAHEALILAHFREGRAVGEIVKAIWGAISGPKYNAARAEVESVIRRALVERGVGGV